MVGEPEPVGLGRGHQVADDEVLLGPVGAHEQRPQHRAAVAAHDARPHVRVADARGVGHETMSQNSASVAPIPMASPLTAAIIGWRIARMLRAVATASVEQPGWPSG